MQAFVKYGKAPGEAAVTEVPRPTPGPGEVLIKVSGCGICGSDLHAYNNDPGYEFVTPPVILGHEFAGMVVEAGPGVPPSLVGSPVTTVAIQGCLLCPTCLSGDSHLCPERKVIGLHFDGAMAGYVVTKADQILPLPSNLDLSLAPLVEPVSVALHALRRTVIRPGDKVVVSGPGPIGLLCAGLAKLHGAKVLLLGMNRDAKVRLPAPSAWAWRRPSWRASPPPSWCVPTSARAWPTWSSRPAVRSRPSRAAWAWCTGAGWSWWWLCTTKS